MKTMHKHAVGGFLFGTVGLYALSALSLAATVFEKLSAPFLWPGRLLAAQFVGSSGSTGEVVMLTVANGVLYALVFVGIGAVYQKLHHKQIR